VKKPKRYIVSAERSLFGLDAELLEVNIIKCHVECLSPSRQVTHTTTACMIMKIQLQVPHRHSGQLTRGGQFDALGRSPQVCPASLLLAVKPRQEGLVQIPIIVAVGIQLVRR